MPQLADGQTASPMNIFVTDASSGIGRAVVKAFSARGHRVTGTTALGTVGAEVIRAAGGIPTYSNLARAREIKSLMQMAAAEVVVHLAPQSYNQLPQSRMDWKMAHPTLVETTNTIVEAAGWVNAQKVILPAFSYIYGDAGGAWVDEKSPVDSSNPLFAAALEAEAAVLDGGVSGYVLRSGYVYSPYSAGLIAAADAIRTGKPLAAGAGLAGWTHASELAQAVLRAAEHHAEPGLVGLIYNIAGETPASADQFIETLANALGLPRPGQPNRLMRLLMPDEIQDALLSSSARIKTERAQMELGWTPRFARLQDGIDEVLLHWRAGEMIPA